jgi:hypothetical protein
MPAVHHPENDRASNLELENRLLRKEVSSLNEEMVSQLQRVKEAEKSKKEYFKVHDLYINFITFGELNYCAKFYCNWATYR